MLLCGTCHSKRVPCRGGHEKGLFGKCDLCGKSDERVSCERRKAEVAYVSQAKMYRFTGWLEYHRPRKK